jgi:hypothetical protein
MSKNKEEGARWVKEAGLIHPFGYLAVPDHTDDPAVSSWLKNDRLT